jgi:hypothetical protein
MMPAAALRLATQPTAPTTSQEVDRNSAAGRVLFAGAAFLGNE